MADNNITMDLIQITNNKLDVAAISASVTAQCTGATSLFVGTTRDNFQGKKVLRLEYEAYEGMARKELEKLCQEVRSKWPTVHKIAIHHRLGVVEVTEASVVIAVSSPHRQDSLEVRRIDLRVNINNLLFRLYNLPLINSRRPCPFGKKKSTTRARLLGKKIKNAGGELARACLLWC